MNPPPIAGLIEVLRIVAKYVDPKNSYCRSERDCLLLPLAIHAMIDADDEQRLSELGATRSTRFDCWMLPA